MARPPVWSVPALGELLSDLEVQRSNDETPWFGVGEATLVVDDTIRVLGAKVGKHYKTETPIELVAYYVTAPPDEGPAWRTTILDFLRVRLSGSIIISIGYGKSANGDLPHRFGPLTQDVGYRRLNVAVTRAKRRLCVISSFEHGEVDLDRSGSRGVRLLKTYLDYAAGGGRRLPDEERAGESSLNPFEADVRDALEGRGIKTRPQFGASRYRIDLVALHPTRPGRPVLAIECDGASYHSGATARDRDRLRQAHLHRLGWRFVRIWSLDWFYGREQETQRVLAAYQDAVSRADLMDANASEAESAPATRPLQAKEPLPRPVARSRGPRPIVAERDSIDQYSDRDLRQIAAWVVSDGLLRTDDELIREIFTALPFERLGPRIRERLEAVARGFRANR